MPPSRAPERLRRLLIIVPYVIQNPGVELAELSRVFSIDEEDLLADLNLLFVTGLPPYGPGDLIDVLMEDGRVWISTAEYLARPLKLTRAEGLALVLRAKALLAVPGLPEAPALQSALVRLEESLGDETLGKLAGRIEYASASGADEARNAVIVGQLRSAAAEGRQLELDYYSASSDSTSVRIVDPEEVFTDRGNWYIVAWDHSAGGERMFRADRIRSARYTGATFARRGLAGAGRPLYERSDADIEVRLRLGPSVRWVAEYYETQSEVETNGFLEVVLPTRHLEWVEKLLLRLGSDVAILGPPELAGRVRSLAERTLALYH